MTLATQPPMTKKLWLKNAFAQARLSSLVDHVEDEPPMPWGKALLRSLRDKWYIFTEARQELAEHFGSKSPGTRAAAPSGAGASSRSFNKSRSNKAITANKVRFTKVKKERVTVKNASKPACGKAVNDKRGCTGLAGKCPKGQYHGCDILLLSTKACCGSKTHTRTQDKEDLHGKWVPFSAPKK